jgi:hypothetical protein
LIIYVTTILLYYHVFVVIISIIVFVKSPTSDEVRRKPLFISGEILTIRTDFVRVELGTTQILIWFKVYPRSVGPSAIRSPLTGHSGHAPDV